MSTPSGRLSRLLESPRLYDLGQTAAGLRWVNQHLTRQIAALPAGWSRLVLDVGGGTGLGRELVAADDVYVCLDMDLDKLEAARVPGGPNRLLRADATGCSLRTATVDVVICKAVSHHIDERAIGLLFAECARVLRPDGRLVFLDPLWSRRRVPGRILWAVDRGSHPRSSDHLLGLIRESFEVLAVDRFSVLHDYLLCVGRPLRPISDATTQPM
jgi:SAM-dependent methyltransferase